MVKHPVAALSFSLLVLGWGWGAAAIGAESGDDPSTASDARLSAEDGRLLFGQSKLPWWVRDMRLQGGAPAAQADLRQVLAENRGREAVKSVLGDDRWRRLDGARFALEVDSLGFTRDPEEDRARKREVEDVLKSNFVKLTREALQARLGLDEWADRLVDRMQQNRLADDGSRGRRDAHFRMRFSPRLSVGDRNRIGVKLRPAGLSAPLLRGAYLKLLQDLDEGSTRAVLAFEHPTKDQDIYVEYRSDDRRQGEFVRFSVRFSY